jgi:phosphatidylglycerol:prolipoprotein diacylglycerol transferase
VQTVGCFAAGCCFGCETAVPWAAVFPEDSLCATPGVPVHPLQVYDALLPLDILGALVVLDRRGGKAARPLMWPVMVVVYAVGRFATEFLRPREAREGLLTSQWLELGAVLAVALLLGPGWRAWNHLVQAGAAGQG